MAKQTRKTVGKCQVILTEFNGRVTMRCQNLKRKPTKEEAMNSAQSILDCVKTKKVIFK